MKIKEMLEDSRPRERLVKYGQEIKGIGFAKACQILALFEFNKRYNLAKQTSRHIKSAEDVFNHFYEKLKDEKQKKFVVLMLNSKNWVIGEEVISQGTLDFSTAHPREVFKAAIKNSASRIILVHNHPSGDPTPSDSDRQLTEKLIEAGGRRNRIDRRHNFLSFML